MEDEKSFQRGLIMMGDLPRWKKMKCLEGTTWEGSKAYYSRDGMWSPRIKYTKRVEVYNNSKCCYNIK
jgi:hypothetical protein